jgi:type IV secretion system protein VirB9
MVQGLAEARPVRAALLAAAALALPVSAFAQQVPGIQTAAASASATVTATAPNGGAAVTVPAGMPPSLHPMSPSAPLNAKEKASAAQAAAWRNHTDRPARGEDGVLRWTFGASLPSVVCAPLQVCDVALQSGERVTDFHVGDSVRWLIVPAETGSGTSRTTHLIIKPTDAGLVSSMLVYTDVRTYSIKLISTQAQWTPLTAFSYPETARAAWAKYGAATADTVLASNASGSGDVGFGYHWSGEAPWRPTQIYSQGGKTVILFPNEMQYGTAPALVGLAGDGGWFSSPTEQMLRYRVSGDRFIIDGLPDHFKLVAGVGGSQQKVDVRRGG